MPDRIRLVARVAAKIVHPAGQRNRVISPVAEPYKRCVALHASFRRLVQTLVGDLHQPLHCATRYSSSQPDGDAGGDGFKIVTNLEWLNNLHRYWDAAGGLFGFERIERPLTAERRELIDRHAREVAAAYPARRNGVWRRMNPELWVAESHQLARRNAYSLRGESPDAAYQSMAQRIARERIALAGYRLAALLNELIGSE